MTIAIPEIEDAPDGASTPYSIDTGTLFFGEISPLRDRDWVAVDLTEGSGYTFIMRPLSDTFENLLLDVYLPNSVFAQNDRITFSDGGQLVDYVATETGTHYLAAYSYFSAARTGSYELSSSQDEIEDRDAAPDDSTTLAISPLRAMSGSIEVVGDEDWYAVELEAGQSYELSVEGQSLNDPQLGLYDEAGALLFSADDDLDFDARVTATVSESGTYYLGVSSAQLGDTGTYRAAVRESAQPSGSANDDHMIITQPGLARSFFAGAGDDTVEGSHIRDWINGHTGNDEISGGALRDTLFGGDGNDILRGNGRRDSLNGGEGRDTLRGGQGADTLDGEEGNDKLIGGDGSDVFVFERNGGRDRIMDFDPSEDTIRLQSVTVGGPGTTAEEIVERYGSIEDGDVVFTLKFGSTLVFRNTIDLEGIAAQIDLIG